MDVLQNSSRGFYIFADDATAFGTGLSGLTISFQLSKAGAAHASVAPTVTDRGDGHYWIVPAASHRNTLGEASWKFSAPGAVIAPRFENVVAYDAQAVAVGASTHDAAAVVTAMQAVAGDFKATGFSTHSAAAVVTAMQAVADDFKATGFSTHNAAAVVTAMQAVADDFKADIGGGSATVENQLTMLALLAGALIQVTSRTTNGTELLSYIGDDDVGTDAQKIVVDDPGEAVKTILLDSDNVVFGAGTRELANCIVGTIDTDNITHADGRTTVLVEISADNKPNQAGGYEYHVKTVKDTAEFVRISGNIELRNERAAV